MSTLIFDTHAAANRYKSAGFTEAQVEALVDTARETTAFPDNSSLATKADLDRLAATAKADIDRLGAATKGDIDRLAVVTKADIDRLDSATKAGFIQLDGKIDRVHAELKTAIASSQIQAVRLMLAGVAAIMAFFSIVPKLIR
jgi:phosphomannomutase